MGYTTEFRGSFKTDKPVDFEDYGTIIIRNNVVKTKKGKI